MSKINREIAEQLVAQELEKLGSPNKKFAVLEANTIETERAWIFFYDSENYIKTGIKAYRVFGNGPIVVEKITGKITQYGSNIDLDKTIKMYE